MNPLPRFSLLLSALLLVCCAARAQQPTQQLATTADGKKVILNPDGTWKYADLSSTPSGTTLRIEAGLIYKTGGPEPVARVTFYLLDAFPLDELDRLPPAKSVSTEFIATCGAEPEIAREIVGRHVIYKLTTGFDGKAELAGIKPGRYWFFGGTRTRRGCALWSHPVDMTKDQSLTLDQHNAVTAR